MHHAHEYERDLSHAERLYRNHMPWYGRNWPFFLTLLFVLLLGASMLIVSLIMPAYGVSENDTKRLFPWALGTSFMLGILICILLGRKEDAWRESFAREHPQEMKLLNEAGMRKLFSFSE